MIDAKATTSVFHGRAKFVSMFNPLTFVALETADVAAVRQVLGSLERDGIYLTRPGLMLETSWLGDDARDVYATAWQWGADDAGLLYALATRGRLLVTPARGAVDIVVCGRIHSRAEVDNGIDTFAFADSPEQLRGLIGPPSCA